MPINRNILAFSAAIHAVSIILVGMPRPAIAQAQMIHVSIRGSDRLGNGSMQLPFRTVTKAIFQASSLASPSMIQLTKGTYSLGEVFPLRVPPGVILRGDEANQGAGVIIMGGGAFSQPELANLNVTILPSDRSELRGITITNPKGYGIWVTNSSPIITGNRLIGSSQAGISIIGNSNALVSNNHFSQNRSAGISISGSASPTLRGNIIQGSALGIDIRQRATPQISDNQIRQNQTGILAQASARPWLRQNRVEQNHQSGLIVLGDASPDLGIGADPGKNIFRGNLSIDIQILGSQTLQLEGNQYDRVKVQTKLTTSKPEIAPTIPTIQANTRSSSLIPAPVQPKTIPIIPLPSQILSIPQPIPKSSVVRISPKSNDQPPAPPAQIDFSLPPITMTPPPGAMVNRPIIIAPVARAQNLAQSSARFRVIVPDQQQIEAIRKSFPQAFPSRQGDRAVVQVGAFGDRNLANLLVQNLVREGFQALIEPLP